MNIIKKILPLSFAVIMVFSLSSCSNVIKALLNSKNSSTSTVEIKSDDEKYSLTIPSNWKKSNDLHEDSIIGALNGAKEQYAIVLNESTQDFKDGFTLKEYFDVIKENMSDTIEGTQWSTETDTIIDGNPAIYIEVSGTIDNMKAMYYIYLVKTSDSFNQILGWTLLSKADSNRQIITDTLKSFKENK